MSRLSRRMMFRSAASAVLVAVILYFVIDFAFHAIRVLVGV